MTGAVAHARSEIDQIQAPGSQPAGTYRWVNLVCTSRRGDAASKAALWYIVVKLDNQLNAAREALSDTKV
jgi:hypothetical protein